MARLLPQIETTSDQDGLSPRKRRDLDNFLRGLELIRLVYGEPFELPRTPRLRVDVQAVKTVEYVAVNDRAESEDVT